MAEDPKYVKAWRRYRRWSRLRWVAFLGYLPFGGAVGGLGKWLGVSSTVTGAMVATWFCFLGATLLGAGFFVCPRCEGFFFFSWYMSNPLTSRCMNCRLPKWATRDPKSTP